MSYRRIMIIDESPEMRRALRVALVGRGYEVTEACTGEEALGKYIKVDPELILLDLNLPGIGGLETCRSIRAGSEAWIIILTVRSSENEEVEVLDAGADGYMVKPFSMEELLARVRAALRRASVARSSPPLPLLGDVEIDLKHRRVRRGGRFIRLKPKEFELLNYLILHTGDIISHCRLLQAVWGPNYGNELEYLRVTINQLRKKIEADPAQPKHLITEPRVGYGFVLPEEAEIKAVRS